MPASIHETAIVDSGAVVGEGTKIWHFCHVFPGAVIGKNCSLGQNVMIADGVMIGDNVKIQNNVSLYTGVTIEDDAFLGPSCVFTNITNPRSQVSRKELYEPTVVRRGATIGANATIVCGSSIGQYGFVSAGAVVTGNASGNVQDYELVIGVPAKHAGWVSRHGHKLCFDGNGIAICPESRLTYKLTSGRERVECMDLGERAPLPQDLAIGRKTYRDYKP